jgi:hypothetical protein
MRLSCLQCFRLTEVTENRLLSLMPTPTLNRSPISLIYTACSALGLSYRADNR